jgi:hypothetical protein
MHPALANDPAASKERLVWAAPLLGEDPGEEQGIAVTKKELEAVICCHVHVDRCRSQEIDPASSLQRKIRKVPGLCGFGEEERILMPQLCRVSRLTGERGSAARGGASQVRTERLAVQRELEVDEQTTIRCVNSYRSVAVNCLKKHGPGGTEERE